jgi:hypothetical protein
VGHVNHSEVIKPQPVDVTLADLPGQDKLADAMVGSSASAPTDSAAGTDGLTVARLKVAAERPSTPGAVPPLL